MGCFRAIGLYRENAIAIESEARDSLNVYIKVERRATCARRERNLHCDVPVAAENKRTLPPFESLDPSWIMQSQRSRRRDEGLCEWEAEREKETERNRGRKEI